MTPSVERRLEFGSKVLVETFEDEGSDVDLRILSARSRPGDGAVFVATEGSAERTLERYESTYSEDAADGLGAVDTTSRNRCAHETEEEYETDREVPIVRVPGPHALARIDLAITDVAIGADDVPVQHLVVRSLSPILAETDADTAARFVRAVARTPGIEKGLSIFTVDVTEHDRRMVERLRRAVDFVLRVEPSADGEIDYELTRTSPSFGTENGR